MAEKKRGRPRKNAEDGATTDEAQDQEKSAEEGTSEEPVVVAEAGPEPKGLGTAIERLNNKINKSVKGILLKPASDEHVKYKRVPTGIVELDLKLHGGWPTGCLNVMYGPPSSGKSLISLETISGVQHFCRKCDSPFSKDVTCNCGKNDGGRVLYLDAENSWTSDWSSAFGIDLTRVVIGRPKIAEEAFDTMEIFIKESAIDLIILDSVAGLCPKTESESSMEEWQQGLVPRLYTKFLRKWAARLGELKQKDGRNTTILFINQIRKKMNVGPYMNPDIMPGGDAQYFFASDIIRVSKKGVEMSADKKDPRPLYQTVKIVLEKSKVSSAKLEGTFDVPIHRYTDGAGRTWEVGEIDNDRTIIEYARKFDVLKDSKLDFRGKTYTKLEDIYGDLKNNVALRWELFKLVQKAYIDYIPSKSMERGEDE